MAIFSTNQVRHLYVVKNVVDGSTPQEVGDLAKITSADNSYFYFLYKDVDSLMRSDIIETKNIRSMKIIEGEGRKTKTVTVTLNSNVNSGNPISGQDYILNIHLRQYIGMSDKDINVKFGAVRATKGDTASTFFKKMAISLAKNFSREAYPLLDFYIGDTQVTALTTLNDLTKETATSLVIKEHEQEWIRGVKSQEPVYYEVHPTTVYEDGEEVIWGETAETYTTTGTNFKEIADLEYFCKGERGDIYRNIGWPNVHQTTYLVQEDVMYDTLEIVYYYEEPGENPQKSEKVLTLVAKHNQDLLSGFI